METQPLPDEERARDSYLRWQKLSVEQLGYVINLFLTFAIAELGFAVKTMMESKSVLPGPARSMFWISIICVLLAIGFALGANLTRAWDFRYTRRAARVRWRPKAGEDHEKVQKQAACYGKWTWWLFRWQTITFGLGTLFLCLSIWIGYGSRI
jgi:hypothetical protein